MQNESDKNTASKTGNHQNGNSGHQATKPDIQKTAPDKMPPAVEVKPGNKEETKIAPAK